MLFRTAISTEGVKSGEAAVTVAQVKEKLYSVGSNELRHMAISVSQIIWMITMIKTLVFTPWWIILLARRSSLMLHPIHTLQQAPLQSVWHWSSWSWWGILAASLLGILRSYPLCCERHSLLMQWLRWGLCDLLLGMLQVSWYCTCTLSQKLKNTKMPDSCHLLCIIACIFHPNAMEKVIHVDRHQICTCSKKCTCFSNSGLDFSDRSLNSAFLVCKVPNSFDFHGQIYSLTVQQIKFVDPKFGLTDFEL